MPISKEAQLLIDFVRKHEGMRLLSTSADVVEFTGVLFNVDGSSDDPEIDGYSWRGLLRERGIDSDCYVTNIQPLGETSHANFSVGGHMTVNEDGSVASGGECYLMPLCSWHNSKARDGMAFEHTETRMLKLFGYMEQEPRATFSARMASDEEFVVVPLIERGGAGLLFPPRLGNQPAAMLDRMADDEGPDFFVLMRQYVEDGQTFYRIEDTKLPDADGSGR
jgi:hypothetical protein